MGYFFFFFARQVELEYPFHRAYEKGGGHAVVFEFFFANSAHWVQKHNDRIGVQLDTTTTTSLMATLSIQSQYQRDVQVLAYVVENDKEKRWAESAATVSLPTSISSSREIKVTGTHRDPEKQKRLASLCL